MNCVPQKVKNEILSLLLNKQLKFLQTCDFVTLGVVESLVEELRQKLSMMSVERAIVLHRAVLLKELYYGVDPVSVKEILSVLEEVKKEKVFRDYLLSVPQATKEFSQKTSARSIFISKESFENWQTEVQKIIEEFLER